MTRPKGELARAKGRLARGNARLAPGKARLTLAKLRLAHAETDARTRQRGLAPGQGSAARGHGAARTHPRLRSHGARLLSHPKTEGAHCRTTLLAGGGVKRGFVHGACDKTGSYPAENPVRPGDLAATIFHAPGIDPQT